MAEWYTVEGDTPEQAAEAQERLLSAWPTAPVINLEVCGLLLETAQEQVIAYAPELDEDEPLPRRYTLAQLKQAQVLFDAGRAQETGEVGPEGFSFIPRPMDKTIKGIIRPVDGKPHVL